MLRRLSNLFQFLFHRRKLEEDLDAELRSSFELIVDRNLARGMAPHEARRTARLEFESLDHVKDQVRDRLTGASLHAIFQDVRYAWRALWRRPSFAIIALVTLALGIGVNTAIFSVFYSVLLRPLPYADPGRLVNIWATLRTAGNARAPVSGTILREVDQRNRSLAGLAGIWSFARALNGDQPEQVKFARVTTNFFDVLGVRAAQGHTFYQNEFGTRAIMLSQPLFDRRFGGDTSLLGKSLPDQNWPNTLVGVVPAGFEPLFTASSNIPSDIQGYELFGKDIYDVPDLYFIRMVARLKPGATFQDAQRDLDRVAGEIRGAYTVFNSEDLHFTVVGMQADAVRDVQPALIALLAGAGFVLLICCVNVASLLLARAADQRKEIALRLALGASRGRILGQLLIESGVLAALAGVAGIAAGLAGFRALLAIRPERFGRLTAELNWPVLAFSMAICLVSAILFGMFPALASFRVDLITGLRAAGRGWLGRMHRRAGDALVIGEITIAFVLVTGAAMVARTLAKIEQVHPGFEPRQLLAFQLAGWVDSMQVWESQLRSIPGVTAEGAISHLPLDKDIGNWYGPYRPEGISKSQGATLVADFRCITPGYLAAMGGRLIEGRDFTADDREHSQFVAIVDEMVAHATWPGQSAIGKKIEVEHTTDRGFVPFWTVVVGVVGHINNHSLTERVRGEIYLPFEQSPRGPMTFVLRTAVPPLTLIPAIRAKVREQGRYLAIAKIRPMTYYVAREVAPASFTAVLAAIFGALSLLLAATGIYGVLNYQVSRRLPEMGIRMALGARSRDVFHLILRQAGALAAIGLAFGAAGAFIATRWLAALLFGVSRHDMASYAAALLLLPAAALIGCWQPAWKAAAADPARIVREE